jgi:hypothetical protein
LGFSSKDRVSLIFLNWNENQRKKAPGDNSPEAFASKVEKTEQFAPLPAGKAPTGRGAGRRSCRCRTTCARSSNTKQPGRGERSNKRREVGNSSAARRQQGKARFVFGICRVFAIDVRCLRGNDGGHGAKGDSSKQNSEFHFHLQCYLTRFVAHSWTEVNGPAFDSEKLFGNAEDLSM